MEINTSRAGTTAPEMPEATREEKLAYWRKERKARRRRRAINRAIGLALAFIVGMAVGYALRGDPQAQAISSDATAPSVTAIDPAIFVAYTPPPMDNARELWSIEHGQEDTPLLDIGLDPVTQWGIFMAACDRDPAIFCFIMAIAEHESEFDPETVGDGGQSLGIMQINTKWHTGRMEALGVTDLTDPVQCALVAVDYIRELETVYHFEPESEALLMAYNMGPKGAREAVQDGRTSTAYSREVMALYLSYTEEMEAAK